MSTAGVVIIGNEVLAGQVEEQNAKYLIGRLRALGVDLRRIVFIRDDVEAIANDVRTMSAAHDHVFTSGGVGATHDDVTMKGIAQAFGRRLEPHAGLMTALKAYHPDAGPAVLRQAVLPSGAELIEGGSLPFPLVKVENVYVFPGVPEFLRAKWSAVEDRFRTIPFVVREFYLAVPESRIADLLTEVDAAFPNVEFGSYPRFDDADHRVKITVQARDPAQVVEAALALLARLDRAWIVRESQGC